MVERNMENSEEGTIRDDCFSLSYQLQILLKNAGSFENGVHNIDLPSNLPKFSENRESLRGRQSQVFCHLLLFLLFR